MRNLLMTLLSALLIGLGGCGDGPMEDAGEELDEAIDEIEDAGEEIDDGTDDAGGS